MSLVNNRVSVKHTTPYNLPVLFACQDSHYKKYTSDIYDITRDARNYSGSLPVVAHPPCRGWGRLRSFAKVRPDELQLARFAVDTVRRVGGVLEHPSGSSLWSDMSLPIGKGVDAFGGFTLKVDQFHWGHKAKKATWLYVCGCGRGDVPQMPLRFDCITHSISGGVLTGLSHKEREVTPPDFCLWLLDLASRCGS